MANLKANTQWLRANVSSVARGVGVDRDNRVINGFIVAEEGPFRSEGRGEFDGKSLASIVDLMRAEPRGLKSRFTHPTLSNDGLGHFLGRATGARVETVGRPGGNVQAVRADLHLSETAFEKNPNGNIGDYLLGLAEEDPDAMGASLVLTVDEELRLDARKRPLTDENGEPLPPLWRPKSLHAVDMVDSGDATRQFLGADLDGLPDDIVRRGSELLDRQFHGCGRDVVEARSLAWLKRYLDNRFGDDAAPQAWAGLPAAQSRNRRRKARLGGGGH